MKLEEKSKTFLYFFIVKHLNRWSIFVTSHLIYEAYFLHLSFLSSILSQMNLFYLFVYSHIRYKLNWLPFFSPLNLPTSLHWTIYAFYFCLRIAFLSLGLYKSALWMWGRTPPPAMVALIIVSSSSSLRIASCKCRGVILFLLKSLHAFPANSINSAVRYSRTAAV